MSSPFLTPLLRLLLPLAVGIAVGEWLFTPLQAQPYAPHLLWGSIVLLIVLATQWQRLVLPLTMLGSLLLGIVLLLHQRQAQHTEWPAQAQTYRALITDTPRPLRQSQRVRVRLLDPVVYGRVIETTLVGEKQKLRTGDGLLLHTHITAPSPLRNPGEMDYAAYLRRQNVLGTAVVFADDWKRYVPSASLTLRERALQMREQLVEQYSQYFAQSDWGTLAAMTLGDRSQLSSSTRKLYSLTGTSHILALSGLHLSILYWLYQQSVVRGSKRAGRRVHTLAVLLGLLLIWAFAFVAGLPTSLVRAALMFSIAQGLSLFARRSGALHSLTLAALLMLLWSPQWLLDVGFQLSCLAVAGIVLLRPLFPTPAVLQRSFHRSGEKEVAPLRAKSIKLAQRLGLVVWEMLLVSFCAQVATAPLVAYYFNTLPLVGLVANFLVIPSAYLLLVGALAFFILPFVRPWLAEGLSSTLHTMEQLLHQLSTLPYASLTLWPSARTIIAAYALLLFLLWSKLRPQGLRLLWRWAGACVFGFFLALSLMVDHRPTPLPQPQIFLYRHSGLCALHYVLPTRQSYLLTSDTTLARNALSSTARRWWAREGWQVKMLPLSLLHTPEGCEQLHRHTPLAAAPHLLVFAHERWAIVDGGLSYAYPRQPLTVDVLLLVRGARGTLAHILRYYRPRRVVLCSSLSPFYRNKFRHEAQTKRLPLHDVEQGGLYVGMGKERE